MVSRKLAIRDEPNIRLGCSRNVKITCFTNEKRLHVYVQNVTVCTGTTRTHVSTCVHVVPVHTGTFERTHGDVLSGHTTQHTHHTTPRTHTTPQHKTQHNTETETEKETEKEDKQREKRRRKRRDKTREEKTKEDKTREERRFIFSVVAHGRFLLV